MSTSITERTALPLANGESIRSQFPLLAGRPGLHYLDSAATAQKPPSARTKHPNQIQSTNGLT